MNIKYISLLSLLFVTGAHAILPDEIIDVAMIRHSRAHNDLRKCQESKDFFGRPCKCINEKNEVTTKDDEYNKVMLKMKDFLNTTVQQGDEATLFERSKKQKAKMAKQALKTIITYEQELTEENICMGRFSSELLCHSSDNITWNKETIEQFDNDLYKTIPSSYDYPFINSY